MIWRCGAPSPGTCSAPSLPFVASCSSRICHSLAKEYQFFFVVVGAEIVSKHKNFQAVLCVSSKWDGNDSFQCPSTRGFWHCRGLAWWELLDFSLPDKHVINSGNAFITGKLRRSEILLYSSIYVLLEIWRWLCNSQCLEALMAHPYCPAVGVLPA